jgi:small subunit ribosomal protein S10
MQKSLKTSIKLKSLDRVSLAMYCVFLKKAIFALKGNPKILGLPVKTRRITLLKSPHVNKKAREQFQIKLYKKNFLIKNFNFNKIIKYLVINKPNNILLSFKFVTK